MRAFEMDVPDGTWIIFSDERGVSGVAFEWSKGKPRTRVDEDVLAVLDQTIMDHQKQATAAGSRSIVQELP